MFAEVDTAHLQASGRQRSSSCSTLLAHAALQKSPVTPGDTSNHVGQATSTFEMHSHSSAIAGHQAFLCTELAGDRAR